MAVGLVSEARKLLPKGKPRDDLEAKIADAEAALQRSDASLAKALGYRLCQCAFPPSIMLWHESRKAYVCPNEACGKTINMRSHSTPTEDLGPNGWMGV